MKKRWKAAPGALFSDSDAQRYGKCIEVIEAEHGYVKPAMVVREGERADSDLHEVFEWNDRRAGRQWRLNQARHLLNRLRVVVRVEGKTKEMKAFYSVHVVMDSAEQKTERAYVMATEAGRNPLYRNELLQQAMNDVAAWRERYRDLKELQSVFRAIERTERHLVKVT